MAMVYQHRRNDTKEVFYVGIGKTQKRAYCKWGRTAHWQRVVAKTSYTIEILYENLTWAKACEVEIELIALYGRLDTNSGCLINKTSGGEGQLGAIITKERRERQSKALKGRPGIPHTDEAKQKISKSKLGILRSQEAKDAMSKACLGRTPWNKGKTMPIGWSPLIGKSKPKLKCPYCNLNTSPSNASRWHFKNCKNKI